MESRSPFTDLFAGVWRHHLDRSVRLAQTASTVGVLAVVALERLLTPTLPVVLALGMVLVCGVAAFAVPWHRLPAPASAVLPVLTIAAIAVLYYSGPPLSTVSLVAVVPATWMGLELRWPGVVAATGVAAAVAVGTALSEIGGDPETSRAGDFAVPVVVFLVANIMCVARDLWDDQHHVLTARTGELAAAAEEAIDSAEVLDVVFEALDAGVLVLDPDGVITVMNPAMHRLRARIGASEVQRTGQYSAVYELDRSTPVPVDQLPTALASRGESFSGRTLWFGANPRRQIAGSVTGRPIIGPDGQQRGAVMVYHDVTDLVLAVQAKDEFVASVSHELRTPLTSIIGYLELVDEDETLPPMLRRHLEIVGRNADRLLALVTDLLSAAQAEGGTMRLERVESDLVEIVRRAMDSARVAADTADIELVTDLTPVAPMLLDPGRVAQVVDNLLSNAIKYTPGGGTVTARVHPDDHEAVITIVDTGIGIAEDEQGELFTKFFRAREVERKAIPGVGLGLVITKAIVEGHGGEIAVCSESGRGTTVTVRLPR
ncbi:MAG: ATP-binding protein [Nocardioidaceae bacterium]|nr:ATP-binding protein [Nocardioidaceae bacterium]